MSKKDKIKKYLKEHRKDITVAVTGSVCAGVAYWIGVDSGARSALQQMAKMVNDLNASRNEPERYEIVGNIIKGLGFKKIES